MSRHIVNVRASGCRHKIAQHFVPTCIEMVCAKSHRLRGTVRHINTRPVTFGCERDLHLACWIETGRPRKQDALRPLEFQDVTDRELLARPLYRS